MQNVPSSQMFPFLAASLAALLFSHVAHAQTHEVAMPPAEPTELAESTPNYLGLELPLLPGERVLPTANGECSVVVFAPHEELYTRFAAFWRKANWNGYCRFGLAHGRGIISGTEGGWNIQTEMVYGLEVNPAEVTTTHVGPDGVITWNSPADTLHFFSGTAFSDPASKRYVIRYETEPASELELDDLSSDWYGTDYLERRTFDSDGREITMSVSEWNVDTFCGFGLPPEFKSFEKEVKKACKKNTDKRVLFRREGFGADPWASRPITWLKSCPVNKALGTSDCSKLVKEAIGKDAAQLETFLTEGDESARMAARQEIIDRYAPLEAVVEEPLLVEAYEIAPVSEPDIPQE